MGSWNDRKVLVTGGAGFIGSNMSQRLLELGAHVRVVDSLARPQHPSSFLESWKDQSEFLPLDLRDPNACLQVCEGQEVVFHLAARAGSGEYYRRHPGRVLTENLMLDTLLLDGALAKGVRAYFYASSSMVYPLERQQSPEAPALKEEDALPANPPNSYGWAKLVGERAVEHAANEHEGFRAAILRLENPYGPGQDIDLERGSIIPVLIRRALEYPRTPYRLRGTGQETRSYCYIEDAIDAMLRAVELLDRRRVVGPLNVSGGERIRILDVAQEIIRQSGREIQLELVPGETRIWGQVLDCSKAHALLNWTPMVPLVDGLRRLFTWVESELEGPHTTTSSAP